MLSSPGMTPEPFLALKHLSTGGSAGRERTRSALYKLQVALNRKKKGEKKEKKGKIPDSGRLPANETFSLRSAPHRFAPHCPSVPGPITKGKTCTRRRGMPAYHHSISQSRAIEKKGTPKALKKPREKKLRCR